MDLYDLKAEYGPVWGTRKFRSLTTAVYELPFGRGRHFMANANRFADAVLGGWRLSNIFLLQSGPFETPAILSMAIHRERALVFMRAVRSTLTASGMAVFRTPTLASG